MTSNWPDGDLIDPHRLDRHQEVDSRGLSEPDQVADMLDDFGRSSEQASPIAQDHQIAPDDPVHKDVPAGHPFVGGLGPRG